MAKNEISIPVFDEEEYSMWKKRMSMFLKMKKCEKVIEREEMQEDGPEWDEDDLKAVNYIYSAISNEPLEFVCEKPSAHEIIKKFDSLYLKESTLLQIVYSYELEKLRLKDYSDTASFFSDFEKSVNELKNAGASITEE